jgi:hypothetical protein
MHARGVLFTCPPAEGAGNVDATLSLRAVLLHGCGAVVLYAVLYNEALAVAVLFPLSITIAI